MYKRAIYKTLVARIREPRRFLQVLAGPRQSGKTTLARQAMEALLSVKVLKLKPSANVTASRADKRMSSK